MTPTPSVEATAVIRKYNEVVTYILSEYRKKFGKDLISSQAKASINRGLAGLLTETGITVRPKWISDLRSDAALQYDKADKVFRATNNLLKKLEFDLMPESALVLIQKNAA